MEERRKERRYVITFPVVVESQGRYSFVSRTRDAGSSGILVMTAARLDVGEPVDITYRLGSGKPAEHSLEGYIVRVEPNAGKQAGEFPYLAAIELSGPGLEIEDLLWADLKAEEEEGS